MTESELLGGIIALSHRYGGDRYVRGGGGNSSCKNADSLWVKPSGTTLRDLEAEQLVVLDRPAVRALHDATPPDDPNKREAFVLRAMMAARRPGSEARPSVEAPLHEAFPRRFVVHTHPALLNGLTCARAGAATCARLFPEALWIDYVDPGYVLCAHVSHAMQQYAADHGRQADLVILENHGIFVAGDSEADIDRIYTHVLTTLEEAYASAGVATELEVGPEPEPDEVRHIKGLLRALWGETASVVRVSGPFAVARGPLTPDHVVYSRAFPLCAEPTREAVDAYREAHGVWPAIVVRDDAVYAVAETEKSASLALEFALDGALVEQLTAAFGGVQYLDDRARRFIENWEVEAYRKKVSTA